jgi:hypothetical protein
VSRQVSSPQVYRAITAITLALSKGGIPKARTNAKDDYQYRSIDDVLGRLSPLLARHRLCVLPRVIRRDCTERTGFGQEALFYVHMLVAYDMVSSRDGSRHRVKASGEAIDPSDKATAKALSAAYKSAMLQTFCIPVGNEAADAFSHRVRSKEGEAEPVQGWSIWAQDIMGTIGICETNEALERVRTTHSISLIAISRARTELYAMIGEAFTTRMKELAARQTPATKAAQRPSPSRRDAAETVDA